MQAERLYSGVMRVSNDRGITKKIDVRRVANGVFLTENSSWLARPVVEFMAGAISDFGASGVLDPFAGDGHMLRDTVGVFPSLIPCGMDIQDGPWQRNDSLDSISITGRFLLCTNPPYLAKYSAARKGVMGHVQKYFSSSQYEDLYLIALERMLSLHAPVVAIVPETFIQTGLFEERLDRVVVLQALHPFSETDVPVCVACFSPDELPPSREIPCFIDDNPCVDLGSIREIRNRLKGGRFPRGSIKFNDPAGALGLRAVDGTREEQRISFCHGESLSYDSRLIKGSSRLLTRVAIPGGIVGLHLERLIRSCNEILETVRVDSSDLVLSPFKGNSKVGLRRRRLDYELARGIIELAMEKLGCSGVECVEKQGSLF